MPTGSALLIETTPLPFTVGTVVRAGVTLRIAYPVIEPLSVAVVGVTVVDWPKTTLTGLGYVTVGAVLAVTLTVKLAVAEPLFESVTVRTAVFAPATALQPAVTVAVIAPAVFVMLVIVMPVGKVVAVTTRLPAV